MENNVLKSGQQSQFLKEKGNEAKVKHDIDVIETINIELEHKVATLLKENETLKRHYKEMFDSIKTTRAKNIEHTTSLIATNDKFKAQIQEKGFAVAALKNELRKLTGNSVNTKFTKPSILGKPVGQPLKNQSVVRQPTAFKSERPRISKPRFASQVDVNNNLLKPVTTHYLPKRRESAPAKPHHMIAPSSSRYPLSNVKADTCYYGQATVLLKFCTSFFSLKRKTLRTGSHRAFWTSAVSYGHYARDLLGFGRLIYYGIDCGLLGVYWSFEQHEVQALGSYNVNSGVSSVEQGRGTVEQHSTTVEETRAYHESLFHNLAAEVEKVNSVNGKMKETNADLTTELATYKNQEKCFEISQEKYDKLERCYQKSVYQEQRLTQKINALHLSSDKKITTLNEEISNLNKQLSKEKSNVSSLLEEKKKLKSVFKIREAELLDKQIQLENKIKELDNILVKTGQSIQTMHMLSPKPDSFYNTEQKMALGYQNPFYLKQAQQKQQSLYNGKVLLEKHDPPVVYDSEETLQLAQESRLKLKQLKKEINQKIIQRLIIFRGFLFLKWPSHVKSYFKSLAKEADESIAKQKALELEIERLLRPAVSQDIMSIVQCNSVIDTSNLQTKLERTKERFENCIIKKENEYAKLWNDWYKKCEECKYDKISYHRAYNVMQQKIERLQAQLGDLKGKSKDTPCVSNTLDPLSQKLENENAELEFQVLNYAKENAHLKTTYKNLFDSIKVTWAQIKAIIDSLQDKFHDTIYKNAKLRAQLFDKVPEQKDTNKGTGVNTQFSKQSILGKPPSSSKPKMYYVTPLPKSTVIPKVASRVDNFVPNKHVKASVRTKPITVSQSHVITKKDVNSNRNGFSPNNVESTTRTKRPQPRNNPKNDKVPFKSKSSCLSNKLEKKEENYKSLQSSNYLNHMSSECNNIKLAIQNEKYKVICATCKQCLITANHDECVLQYVNGMKSRKKNQSANVSKSANQEKHKPKVRKPKKVGSKERLASPKPSTPRSCLRWSPTGRMFDLKGKIVATSESVFKTPEAEFMYRSASCLLSSSWNGLSKVSKYKGIVPIEKELVLEQTQQDASHEVSSKSQPLISFELLWRQSQPSKCFGNGEGLPTWHLYNWGGSRVDEMILARERSGFAGKKVWDDIPVVTGFVGRERRLLGK
ncbi:hypothetical protein Tco_0268514 [Tanacetum coccineum]